MSVVTTIITVIVFVVSVPDRSTHLTLNHGLSFLSNGRGIERKSEKQGKRIVSSVRRISKNVFKQESSLL